MAGSSVGMPSAVAEAQARIRREELGIRGVELLELPKRLEEL